MAKVSGWVELKAKIDLKRVSPSPSEWDVRRLSDNFLTMDHRETEFRVQVKPDCLRVWFQGNPRAQQVPEEAARFAKEVLKLKTPLDPASATLWSCGILVEIKTFRKFLNLEDQSKLADIFPGYEVFQRAYGRVKMVYEDHSIYCGGSACKTLVLWPNDKNIPVKDLPQFVAIANHTAATLESLTL